jgi:hypothetical protein
LYRNPPEFFGHIFTPNTKCVLFGGLFFFVYLWRSKNNLEHDFKLAEILNPAEKKNKFLYFKE